MKIYLKTNNIEDIENATLITKIDGIFLEGDIDLCNKILNAYKFVDKIIINLDNYTIGEILDKVKKKHHSKLCINLPFSIEAIQLVILYKDKLDIMLSSIYSLSQVILAIKNNAKLLNLDFNKLGKLGQSGQVLLSHINECIYDNEDILELDVMCSNFSNNNEIEDVVLTKASILCLTHNDILGMYYHPLTENETK